MFRVGIPIGLLSVGQSPPPPPPLPSPPPIKKIVDNLSKKIILPGYSILSLDTIYIIPPV